MSDMTQSPADVRERVDVPGLPDGMTPLTGVFTTHHAGRPHAIVLWQGAPWLVWQHPDGHWVTEAKVQVAALLRTPRGEVCSTVDETYCATHDCGAHDDEKCGRPGCQHCDAQTVGDRHRLSRQLLALASVIEGGGKPSNSVADDVRRAASALVYTPPPLAMRQVTGRLASLLDSDADWLHDEALAGRLPDRCQAIAERIRAALRPEAQGEGRWEDLVFGPITQAYNEAHAARRGEGGE